MPSSQRLRVSHLAANTPMSDSQKETGGVLKPPPYLSPSSIETFRQCPLKFKYSRIDRLFDPPTEATVLGSFVHAVLETLYALPSEQRTLAEAKAIMGNLWSVEWGFTASEVLKENEKALHNFRWQAWWCIENYFALENPTQIDPKGIEHELNSRISSVPIKGFIDRWHREKSGIVISDYKTGKTPRPPYVEPKFFQLLVYADILGSELQEQVTRVELLYLKDGVRLQLSNRNEIAEKIASMREVVAETHTAVIDRCNKGEFEPTVNKLCDWCSYKSFCPAWQK